jgi:prepilin-type processing-associated H-X9-DG protein
VLGRDTATRFADITDGTSGTFLIGEMSWNQQPNDTYRAWHRGCNRIGGSGSNTDGTCVGCKNVRNGINTTSFNGSNNFNNVSFGSNHPGGTHFGMCDGHAGNR